EWAFWTPFVQIAVNNEFERINETSPYQEDLRNFNALPLKDWGIVFKPQFWAFFVLPPATAFSLMHTSIFVACLVGWYFCALALGFNRTEAALLSVTIFALPYVQL